MMSDTQVGIPGGRAVKNKLLAIFGVLVLLAAAAVTVPACGDADGAETGGDAGSNESGEGADDRADEDDDEKEEAVPVEVAALGQGPIESVLSFSSSLEVESQVQVFSQAKRLVRELLIEEGDPVERGQLLLRLQDEEQRSALNRVESELSKARKEFERNERLHEQELISDQQFADTHFEFERLQIALEDAERELSYTEVRAPISGTITQRTVNLGDQVQIGQDLFQIMNFDTMVARVFVPEKHLPALRPGLEARISAAATGDREFTARVERIAPIVEARSGTVKVTVAVGRQAGLRPGLYVDVDLVTATHADALLVPKRALVYDNDQMFVYRLGEERRVERVYIEAALSDRDWIEPAEGLTSGDEIVIAGQAGLKDGALVELPGDDSEQAEDGDDEEAVEVARR
jgi:membrane fusion protein (multidrug efflux system)